ncbi:RHS repeat-associated core domain-containing protein [Streptomyces coelicoflavus]|uniref:RHS repeat-associated core domain-containing protein n=1 Tax=Streptomyces coelicoflavus TaxID=285562 RepID=UPI003A88F172
MHVSRPHGSRPERGGRGELTESCADLTDATGNVLDLVDDAGKHTHTYAYGPTGLPRTTPTEAAPTQPFRYAGAYADPTGLYKMGHRYYDPALGRFTQPDPSGQETNPYLYADGDAVNNSGPTGLFSWPDVGSASGGAVAGLAAATAVAAACAGTVGIGCVAAGAVTGALWGGASAGLGAVVAGGDSDAAKNAVLGSVVGGLIGGAKV